MAVNGSIMVFEVGGIIIALLKIFSDMQLPVSSDTPRPHVEATFAIISCLCTVVAFAVNVLGVRKLLRMFCSIRQSVMQRMSATFLVTSGKSRVAVMPITCSTNT